MIEETDDGYILEDRYGQTIELEKTHGKVTVLFLYSAAIDFYDSLHRIAGADASRNEAIVMLDQLGIRVTGHVRVQSVNEDEVAVVVDEDSRVLINQPWATEETEIF